MVESLETRAKRVFDQMIDHAAVERAARLALVCAGDNALRVRVETLLAAAEKDDAFLRQPTLMPLAPRAKHIGEQPGDVIGAYKLLELLGEGGFGSVFLAEQAAPVRRQVALKVIKAGMDTKQVIARFELERQALALMEHANIARVFDAGATETGRPYFVMELVRGEPITRLCDDERLSLRQRLELFRDVCGAVQHAHQKGIIHRDLKPSNILVSRADGAPLAKVIDFGIAKAIAAELTDQTLTGQFQPIGTPEYMSPERMEPGNTDVDTRSDIYSLGVLLYELLTGTTPFRERRLTAGSGDEARAALRVQDPLRPSARLQTRVSSARIRLSTSAPVGQSEHSSSINPIASQRRAHPAALARDLRRDLDWIVLKCLERDRTRRYETASALADDIARYLDDQPVLATPPSAAYRLRKFVRRNRGVVIAGSAIAATLLLATGISVAFGLTAAQQRRAASLAEIRANTRADELEKVAGFQETQLSRIDAQTMGVRLREDLHNKARAAAERARLSPEGAEARVQELEQLTAGIDFTGLALEALSDNFFQPALAAIDEQFAQQPIVRARLLQTLASTLQRLGLLDAATEPQESALAIRRHELGNEHHDTLASLTCRGSLLAALGRHPEADLCFQEVLETNRRVLGDNDPDTLQSIINVGNRFYQRGKWTEAERCYREALGGYRCVLGNEHADTLRAIDKMGTVLNAQGKSAEAEPYFREALETRRRVAGDQDIDTLRSFGSVAFVLHEMGMPAESRKYSSAALEGYRRIIAGGGPDALAVIGLAGGLLQFRGDLAEAEPYYRDALEIRRRLLGNSHPDTLNSIGMLGRVLRIQGKVDEAEQYGREALAIRRRLWGDEDPKTLSAMIAFGQQLLEQGKRAEAETYCREALEKRDRLITNEYPDTLLAAYRLGALLTALDKPAEAVELLAPAEPAARRAFTGAIAHHLGRFLTTLGRARTATGEFAAAEAELTEAHAIMSATADPADRIDVLSSLVELFDARHAPEPHRGYDALADEWRDKLRQAQALSQIRTGSAPIAE